LTYNLTFHQKNGGKIDWKNAAEDFRQVMAGMTAVHEHGIIHRGVCEKV